MQQPPPTAARAATHRPFNRTYQAMFKNGKKKERKLSIMISAAITIIIERDQDGHKQGAAYVIVQAQQLVFLAASEIGKGRVFKKKKEMIKRNISMTKTKTLILLLVVVNVSMF
jgi:hypothetical protein